MDNSAIDIAGLTGMTLFLVVLLGFAIYFFPTIVASSRHAPNTASIVIINIFLGWTFVGWIVALAMAFADTRRRVNYAVNQVNLHGQSSGLGSGVYPGVIEDPTAKFRSQPPLLGLGSKGFGKTKVFFLAEGIYPPIRTTEQSLIKAKRQQKTAPVSLFTRGTRHWWWFQDRIYCERSGYSAEEVLALLQGPAESTDSTGNTEVDHIPEDSAQNRLATDVRSEVFQRDQGRCVQCGATQSLQFNYIIPLESGGANSAQNLEVLCSTCASPTPEAG